MRPDVWMQVDSRNRLADTEISVGFDDQLSVVVIEIGSGTVYLGVSRALLLALDLLAVGERLNGHPVAGKAVA
ncbi:hypothetical protein AWN90_00105 [Nocardia terpenica]|uniref:Uncharacterized protein n=2 Tax=Nocardia terpenica TaxID=455432 RepID=A0A161WGR7_9NOCA|nr:hypothetical protein AWN90_00105 [Nocardia terpenica]